MFIKNYESFICNLFISFIDKQLFLTELMNWNEIVIVHHFFMNISWNISFLIIFSVCFIDEQLLAFMINWTQIIFVHQFISPLQYDIRATTLIFKWKKSSITLYCSGKLKALNHTNQPNIANYLTILTKYSKVLNQTKQIFETLFLINNWTMFSFSKKSTSFSIEVHAGMVCNHAIWFVLERFPYL